MQQDDKYYTFLLSHSTKSKIYIRRVDLSKKTLHTGMASLILFVGIASIGVFGFFKNNVLAKTDSDTPNQNVQAAKPLKSIPNKQSIEAKSINYARPATSDSFSFNSGGPASPFQLTLVESETEEADIEKQLNLIQATSNPAFLPTIWAHLGKINNEFGFRRNPFGGRSYEFHAGMDIDGDRGDTIIAPANGIVVKAGWQGGYGNMIELNHGNGLTTRYGHLSKIEVKEGDTTQRGQLIGLIGSTGRSTGPHLHYELRLNDKSINPRRFLPPEPTEIKSLNAK